MWIFTQKKCRFSDVFSLKFLQKQRFWVIFVLQSRNSCKNSLESSWNWIKKIEFQRAEQLFLPSLNQQEFWRVHRNWIKHLEFQRAEQTFLPSLNRPRVIKSSWKLLKSSWNWIKNLEFQRAEQLFLPSLNRSESWKAHRNWIKKLEF